LGILAAFLLSSPDLQAKPKKKKGKPASGKLIKELGEILTTNLVVKYRVKAALKLAKLKDPRALPYLIKSSKMDPEGKVRVTVVRAFAVIGTPRARVALARIAKADRSKKVRSAASKALVKLVAAEAAMVEAQERKKAREAKAAEKERLRKERAAEKELLRQAKIQEKKDRAHRRKMIAEARKSEVEATKRRKATEARKKADRDKAARNWALMEAQRKRADRDKAMLARATSAKMVVLTEPPKARVTVDEEFVKRSPAVFSHLKPGTHLVEVAKPGYITQTRTVRLAASASQELNFTLVAGVNLQLRCRVPGATFKLDDKPVRKLPRLVVVPAGKHTITVGCPGCVDETQEVDAQPGKPIVLTFTPRQESGTLKIADAPDGMTVMVDGNHVGKTPLKPIPLSVGKHALKIGGEGFATILVPDVAIEKDKEKMVSLSGKVSRVALLLLHGFKGEGVKVTLNGETLSARELAAGKLQRKGGGYHLRATRPFHHPISINFTMDPARPEAITLKWKPTGDLKVRKRKVLLGWAFVGGGAALLVGAIATGAASVSSESDAEEAYDRYLKATPAEEEKLYNEAVDKQKTSDALTGVSIGFGIGAAAALGFGLYNLLTLPDEQAETAALPLRGLSVTAGPDQVGIGYAGRF